MPMVEHSKYPIASRCAPGLDEGGVEINESNFAYFVRQFDLAEDTSQRVEFLPDFAPQKVTAGFGSTLNFRCCCCSVSTCGESARDVSPPHCTQVKRYSLPPTALPKGIKVNVVLSELIAEKPKTRENYAYMAPQQFEGPPESYKPYCFKVADDTYDSSFKSTLMIRNIPHNFTGQRMAEEIRSRKLLNDIDFLYVPIDYRHRCNLGYCFVNVISLEAKAKFHHVFSGINLQHGMPHRPCVVCDANVQGLQANMEAFRRSGAMHSPDAYRPLVVDHGDRYTMVPAKFDEPNGLSKTYSDLSSSAEFSPYHRYSLSHHNVNMAPFPVGDPNSVTHVV